MKPSLSFSTSSVSVDVGGSKTVAVKYAGDDVETVGGIIEGKSLCDVAWKNINQSAGTADLVITGKKTGNATITLNLMDKNGKTLCSKSLGVTVNSLGYTVTYNANGGTGAPAAQTKDYGKALTLSSTKPTRAGYIFTGWAETPVASHVPYQPGSSFSEDRNLTLYAIWMADPYMRYQVKHYKENLDGSYTLADTDNRFGVTSVDVYPPVRSYEGFVSPAVQTAVVPTVQDTVLVNYYYKRQNYRLAVNAEDGIQVSGGGEYRYGQSVTVTANVKEGYEWSGWSSNIFLAGINPKSVQITFPMPAANVTLKAAAANGIVSWSDYNSSNVSGAATRAQFAQIMAKALPEAGFSAFNPVANGAIPDVSMSAGYAPAVYKLYRAGILSGGDVNGTFFPQTYITRAESAAVVARIADSGNRVQFSLI